MTKTFITNLFIGLVAFLVFSGVAAVASAQEETEASEDPASVAETREAKKAEIQEKRDEQKAALDERREAMASNTEAMREKVEERREEFASRTDAIREKIEERKTAINERVKNRILALADNVTRKMNAAIGRLTQIISRFEARIEVLEEKGVDGSAAQTKLDEATGHLARAASILENDVNDDVDNTVGSDNPQEAWQAAKAKFGEAREAIRSAHQALRDALALLKQAVTDAGLDQGVSSAARENTVADDEDTENEGNTEEDTASSTETTSE